MIDDVPEDIVGKLAVAVFRLNGRLIETGNHLVMPIGLTSAWWQVLGALGEPSTAIPVPHIARNMGLSRQAVQRITDLLADKGFIEYAPNPHHQRAKLVVLTAAGAAALSAAKDRQRPLSRELLALLGPDRLASALDVLTQMDLELAGLSNGNENDAE